MEKTIEGKIISRQLGEFGHNQMVYGYVGIEKLNGEQIMVKVDSYTWYETLEIGADVFVETDNLGSTDILVARRIDVNQHPLPTSNQEITANV
ncbi:MAG: hypothetical protein ACFFEV_08255 [Candidatus Thorarchaeota archaeon]